MTAVTKSFPGVKALDACSLVLHRGEVHALVGGNGAGKSTLMKRPAGIHKPDSREIRIKGQKVDLATPAAALARGVSIIHQELQMMEHLTSAENFFIGREHKSAIPFVVSRRKQERAAAELMACVPGSATSRKTASAGSSSTRGPLIARSRPRALPKETVGNTSIRREHSAIRLVCKSLQLSGKMVYYTACNYSGDCRDLLPHTP